MNREDTKNAKGSMRQGVTSGDASRANALSNAVVGACVEVHRALGPGLLESVYEECLCRELSLTGVEFERQRSIPIQYKGVSLDVGYRLDLVIADLLVVEIKSVEALLPIHQAQLLTYLKLTGITLGLLANFNVLMMRQGIRRIVHNFDGAAPKGSGQSFKTS